MRSTCESVSRSALSAFSVVGSARPCPPRSRWRSSVSQRSIPAASVRATPATSGLRPEIVDAVGQRGGGIGARVEVDARQRPGVERRRVDRARGRARPASRRTSAATAGPTSSRPRGAPRCRRTSTAAAAPRWPAGAWPRTRRRCADVAAEPRVVGGVVGVRHGGLGDEPRWQRRPGRSPCAPARCGAPPRDRYGSSASTSRASSSTSSGTAALPMLVSSSLAASTPACPWLS